MQSPLFIFFVVVTSVLAESTGLVFFRKVNNDFIPLSTCSNEGFSILSTDATSERPPEFSFHQGYAVTKDVHNAGDAGFFGGALAFGPKVITETRFELDGRGKIIKPILYDCRDPFRNSFHSYLAYRSNSLCVLADVYLLPSDAGNNLQ